ncbi:MAG: outer membrane lipoprotein carrier protein LolA [bacterium]
MKRFFLAVFVLFFLISPARGLGKEDEVRTALDLLESTYRSVTSLRARFIQSEERPGVGVSTSEEGRMSFMPPGKMRWDYKGKRPHRVVINDNLVWIYTPGRNQVVRREMSLQEMRIGPMTFMRGLESLEEQFRVYPGSDIHEGKYSLDLFPIDEKTSYERIGILISTQTGLLERIRIHHRLGNLTTIEFSDIRTGVKFPDDLFEWDIPEGTKIIEP